MTSALREISVPRKPRTAVIGSTASSGACIEALINYDFELVGVLGLSPDSAANVSGYQDLAPLAKQHGLPFQSFNSVSEGPCRDALHRWGVDLLFVVGLSQLVPADIRGLARCASIGFHPTRLPTGRGRAPIAWLILSQTHGAGSFFLLEDEADSGEILAQVPFEVQASDYAEDVLRSALQSIPCGIEQIWNQCKQGRLLVRKQDASQASFFGIRKPDDGLLDWNLDSEYLARLVRSASRPHPGAFTLLRGERLRVWRARPTNAPIQGATARIVALDPAGLPIVQCGTGLLVLEEYEGPTQWLRVGEKLGDGILQRVAKLEQRLTELEAALITTRK